MIANENVLSIFMKVQDILRPDIVIEVGAHDADFAKAVKFDGVNYTASGGIVTIQNIAPGVHTITKGDTTNLYYIKTVYAFMATGDTNKAQVSLYPNPVSDYLHINTAGQKILNAKVYTFAGSLVKDTAAVTGNSLDLRNLSAGNYIISVTTDKGTITKKIIKK
jgi:pectate lyase